MIIIDVITRQGGYCFDFHVGGCVIVTIVSVVWLLILVNHQPLHRDA